MKFSSFLLFIIGDHPELQFESGNQIGGTYPCMCGANGKRFHDFARSTQHALISLEERREKVPIRSQSLKELKVPKFLYSK